MLTLQWYHVCLNVLLSGYCFMVFTSLNIYKNRDCLYTQDNIMQLNITSLAILSIPEIQNLRVCNGLTKMFSVSVCLVCVQTDVSVCLIS